jgi:hypothetical protein
VLVTLFRTAGHTVRTQHGATASAGQRRGDVEIRMYMRDQAGSRSSWQPRAAERFPIASQDLEAHLRLAAQRKINGCRQQYADNQNISFLPAIMSTSTRESSKTPNPPSSPTPLFAVQVRARGLRSGPRLCPSPQTQLSRLFQYQT